MKTILALLMLLTSSAWADVTSFPVRPSATDAQIRSFDEPHWVYVDRDIVVAHRPDLPQDRHQLLLWLTGTGGKGHDAQGFSTLAAGLGYHVVTLMYPDDTPAATCDYSRDPNAFEAFRMAIIQGGDATMKGGRQGFSISRTESIENRLIKLLVRLQTLRPRENWGQFFNPDATVRWEAVAVGGQSQGGGHAALIGIKHAVARVLCFGAPKDYSKWFNAPAAWYSEGSATPKGRFFAFNHVKDPKGCTPEQQLRNLKALSLDAFGLPANVDTESYPYRHARILYTGYPTVSVAGEDSEGALLAHGSAVSSRNADRWRSVWTYMLTDPVP